MSLISLDEAKAYLRVDSSVDDELIDILISSAESICADVARIDENKWAIIIGCADNVGVFETAELEHIRSVLNVAVMYALSYLYEHREEADYNELTITLRSLLFGIREGKF